MNSSKPPKPRVYTFKPNSKCINWSEAWKEAGFEPVVLPHAVGFRIEKVPSGDGATSPLQLLGSERLIASYQPRIDHYVKRIMARPNAPSLDGYFRWLWTAVVADNSQYVFMTQPDIFPGNLKNGLLTDEMCRRTTGGQLCLLAGSDAVMGTKLSFLRMCDMLAGDYGVTAENATDAFIVRRVQHQQINFIVDLPRCKNRGDKGWEQSPLVRKPPYVQSTFVRDRETEPVPSEKGAVA